MAGEWQTVPLNELYEFSSGLSKPRSAFGSGYPFLSFKDVFYNFFVPKALTELVNSTEQEREKCSIKRGDVFLTRTSETMDELGMSSVALADIPNATFNGFTKRLRPKPNEWIVPEYAGYFFRSQSFRQAVTAMSTMSTRASLNNEMLGRLSIDLPPLAVQTAIGHILGTLDDKIELNRRMNETLETIARAIFKSWFVDFDPVRAKASGEPPESICRRLGLTPDLLALFPSHLVDSELGEIPEGWEWNSIGDQVEIVGGGTPSTKESKYWDDGAYHWTTPKDLSGNPDKVLLRTERKITEKGLATISSGLLPAGTVLMSSRAPVGYLAIAKVPTAINQGFIAMKCHKLLTPEYALQWANSVMDEIKQRASGTTFAEISKKNFRLIKVLVPTASVVHEYTTIAQGLYDRITANVAESDSLSEIRDSLLPKLLSGELLIAETIDE